MAPSRENSLTEPNRLRLLPGLLALEVALILAIFWADAKGYVPISNAPFLLVVAWGSMWLRGVRWRDIGFNLPQGWPRLAALGAIAGGLLWVLEFFVTMPLLRRILGVGPDLEGLASVVGNVGMLVAYLVFSWLIAALCQELTWRGYLMQRIAQFFGQGQSGWYIALVITSVGFASFHLDLGPSGFVQAAVSGVLLAALYLATGRNLVAPIIAHGTCNTIGLVLIYLGRHPGIGN